MTKLKTVAVGILLTCVLTGCFDPKIDASSEKTLTDSIAEVRESLPASQRTEFDEALRELAFGQVNFSDLFAAGAVGPSLLQGKVRDALHGKTAKQVIAEADRIRAERKEQEKQQALAEIRALEERRAQSEKILEELGQFQVLGAWFYVQEQPYGLPQRIIELTVRNDTMRPVSQVQFEGALTSPGRSVPWYKGPFSYEIPGGIEPDEETTWQLTPNMFSDWGKADAPADAVLIVTVEQIDGPSGGSTYSIKKFSEQERERLRELKQQYDVR